MMFNIHKAALIGALLIFAGVMVAQERPEYGMYYESGQACLDSTAEPSSDYIPTVEGGLIVWDAKVLAGEAKLGTTGDDIVCGRELTYRHGYQIIRYPKNTPMFMVGNVYKADGRCGNEITEIWVKKTRVTVELPPPTPKPVLVVRRVPVPLRERSVSPPPVSFVRPFGACEAILSTFGLDKLSKGSDPIVIWPEISNGTAVSGSWAIDGAIVSDSVRLTLDPHQFYKEVKGKAGAYELGFIGQDAHGNELSCAVDLTLVKQGRHWFWKLPGIHCLYAFTHDINKWKGGPLAEKAFCLAEAGVAYYYWPVRGVKVFFKPNTPFYTRPI